MSVIEILGEELYQELKEKIETLLHTDTLTYDKVEDIFSQWFRN